MKRVDREHVHRMPPGAKPSEAILARVAAVRASESECRKTRRKRLDLCRACGHRSDQLHNAATVEVFLDSTDPVPLCSLLTEAEHLKRFQLRVAECPIGAWPKCAKAVLRGNEEMGRNG